MFFITALLYTNNDYLLRLQTYLVGCISFNSNELEATIFILSTIALVEDTVNVANGAKCQLAGSRPVGYLQSAEEFETIEHKSI